MRAGFGRVVGVAQGVGMDDGGLDCDPYNVAVHDRQDRDRTWAGIQEAGLRHEYEVRMKHDFSLFAIVLVLGQVRLLICFALLYCT